MSGRQEYSMTFSIQGQLGDGFSRSFQQAAREMRNMQNVSNTLNARIRDISAYQRQQSAIERQTNAVRNSENRLEVLQQRHADLHQAMNDTENPSQRLRQQLLNNEQQIQRCVETIDRQNQSLREMQMRLDSAGDSLRNAGIDTNNLTDETARLQRNLDNFRSAQENLNEVSESLRTAQSEFKNAAKDFATTAGAIAAAVGTAYAATSKQAIDFESAFAGVKKTVDGTPEQLNEIREGILKMSQADVTSTAKEIAAVAENAGQLGIQTDNVVGFSKVMIDLGNSTNLSSEDAASSLAKFANVTQMSQDNFDRLGSVIVDLGNNFATTESDIVEMGTRLASTGNLTGLSEAQIMAVATAVSSLGIEAEAGGTAMSKLLKSFAVADATGNMKKYADIAGMSEKSFSELYKKDSLSAISAFTKGLNDTERNGKGAIEILNDLGISEVRLSNAVLSLATSDDILTKAADRANQAWEENTALSKEAEQRYSTTESKIAMAKTSVQNLGITIGDMTLPMVAKLASGFAEAAQHAQRWVSENEESIKGFVKAAAEIAKYVLLIKGTKVAYTGLNTAGMAVVKGIAKVKTAIAAARTASAAGTSGVNAFASSLTGLSAGASGFVAVGAATVAVLAAIAAAVYINNKEVLKAREAYADGQMFANGLPKLKDYTEALKESTSESYKFAQEINNSQEKLNEIGYEMSRAHDSVVTYGSALREKGTLSPSEAQKMIEPFDKLVSTLEEDFTIRYNAVFDAFKKAASEAADNLGVDIAEISGILDTFKEKYTGSLNDSQKVVDDLLSKRSDGGTLSSDELAELQRELSYISDMSGEKSENLYNFQQSVQEISGMDLGNNKEYAIQTIKEMTQYASDYIEEIDEAQKTLDRYYDDLRDKADKQFKHGKITQEEWESYTENLNLAQGITYENYAKNRSQFTSELKKISRDVLSQIDDTVIKAVDGSGISFWDSYIGTLSAYGNFFTGKGFTGQQEAARGNAINATRDIYKDIIAEANNLSNAASIDPITIPVEVQTYVNNQTQSSTGGFRPTSSGEYTPTKSSTGRPMGQHARGTPYSEDTFIAGELGPEIVTNAPAHRVYTAKETQDIFNGYKTFAAILPQAMYTMSAVASAPTVNAVSGGKSSVIINYTPNITATEVDDLQSQLEQHDNELFERIERYFQNRDEDERRNAYF